MNLQGMIEFWERKIPQTAAASQAAQDDDDPETAMMLHTLAVQQTAFKDDLEALRMFWLLRAAERPEAGSIIRAFCNGKAPLTTIVRN